MSTQLCILAMGAWRLFRQDASMSTMYCQMVCGFPPTESIIRIVPLLSETCSAERLAPRIIPTGKGLKAGTQQTTIIAAMYCRHGPSKGHMAGAKTKMVIVATRTFPGSHVECMPHTTATATMAMIAEISVFVRNSLGTTTTTTTRSASCPPGLLILVLW